MKDVILRLDYGDAVNLRIILKTQRERYKGDSRYKTDLESVERTLLRLDAEIKVAEL